jgi:hypothetical protein
MRNGEGDQSRRPATVMRAMAIALATLPLLTSAGVSASAESDAQDLVPYDPVALGQRLAVSRHFNDDYRPPFSVPARLEFKETPDARGQGLHGFVSAFMRPSGGVNAKLVMMIYDDYSKAERAAKALAVKEPGLAGSPQIHRAKRNNGDAVIEYSCSHFPPSAQSPPKRFQCTQWWTQGGKTTSQVIVAAFAEGVELKDEATARALREAAMQAMHPARRAVLSAELALATARIEETIKNKRSPGTDTSLRPSGRPLPTWASMERDGTIILQQFPESALEPTRRIYARSDPRYEALLREIGPLKPGEVRPIGPRLLE